MIVFPNITPRNERGIGRPHKAEKKYFALVWDLIFWLLDYIIFSLPTELQGQIGAGHQKLW